MSILAEYSCYFRGGFIEGSDECGSDVSRVHLISNIQKVYVLLLAINSALRLCLHASVRALGQVMQLRPACARGF